ncbi:MAG: GldG family protein [Clostridia bacterium]|nr:GldG family protein [Clostridia bacterium]
MKNKKEKEIIIETSAEEIIETEEKEASKLISSVACFFKNITKFFRSGKIRNQALLKRGGYSLIITSIVLAVLIAFNVLMSVLSERYHLEIDMTENAQYSMTEENIEFIEKLDNEVNITIVGSKDRDTYTNYLYYYASNLFGISVASQAEYDDLMGYFEQTLNLIDKYGEYNEKVNVTYLDPQEPAFNKLTQDFPDYEFLYGDIVVDATINGNERVKILTFEDVYALSEGTTSYYGTSYTINANKLESSLTSAIAYVTSTESKKVVIISGHSTKPYTSAYVDILTANNYEIAEIKSPTLAKIPDDCDAIIISAPTIDFLPEELTVISEFLDNNGKLGKGLIFFADAASPYLPNLYGFLKQWGISAEEGIIFETNESNAFAEIKTTLGTFPVALENDKITENIGQGAITDYNVPMKVCNPVTTARVATALMRTSTTAVIAPVGLNKEWKPAEDAKKQQFDTVIQSVETGRDADGKTVTSYVMAFASVEYIQSTWASYAALCNQNIVMAVSDRAAHVTNTSITFTSKFIKNESFIADEATGDTLNWIFVIILPILVIALGVVIFVRRRNAR